MTRDNPTPLALGDVETTVLPMSSELVSSFAALSGDHSSLHTDPTFARRSMYRERVAHGMIPVLALARLSLLHKPGATAFVKQLRASFLRPVFIGESVLVSAEVVSVDENAPESELAFTVKTMEADTVVSRGTLVLAFTKGQPAEAPRFREAAAISPSLLLEPLLEQDLALGRIARGDETSFRFQIRPQHAEKLRAILSTAGTGPEAALDLRPFLAASLLSTFVGMCRPGCSATFLEFSLSFGKALAWSTPHLCTGRVAFVSESTQTVVEQIMLRPETDSGVSDPVATAKLKTKVNETASHMPGLTELQQSAVELQLRDKVVLVTGASRGIGETIAKLFSLHGAHVAVNYHSGAADAARIVMEIENGGGLGLAVRADVTDEAQVCAMVHKVCERLGPVDILINNAVRNFVSTDFLSLPWIEFVRDIDVVIKGAFLCCQAVLPSMMERGGGKIINLGTVATDYPPPGQSKYVVAKSGLLGLTRSLAVEFARHNIQVNMVAPGFVETDLTAGVPKMFRKQMKNQSPMKRFASPVEVAKAVVFLASQLASYTTGQRVMVTGGAPPCL